MRGRSFANPEIDIVIELIGGYGIAKTLVLEAIAAGKHVVTANKALAGRAWHRDFCSRFRQRRDGGV
jgi:homoserine dehydrogenase